MVILRAGNRAQEAPALRQYAVWCLSAREAEHEAERRNRRSDHRERQMDAQLARSSDQRFDPASGEDPGSRADRLKEYHSPGHLRLPCPSAAGGPRRSICPTRTRRLAVRTARPWESFPAAERHRGRAGHGPHPWRTGRGRRPGPASLNYARPPRRPWPAAVPRQRATLQAVRNGAHLRNLSHGRFGSARPRAFRCARSRAGAPRLRPTRNCYGYSPHFSSLCRLWQLPLSHLRRLPLER